MDDKQILDLFWPRSENAVMRVAFPVLETIEEQIENRRIEEGINL